MAITFTRKTQTYNAETGVMTTASGTVVGSGMKVKSDVQRFTALELSLTETITLFFTPETYGELPEPGDEVIWPAGGTLYRVKDVDTIAPDGVVIAARVAIGR